MLRHRGYSEPMSSLGRAAASPQILIGLASVVAFVLLSLDDGGFQSTSWLPATLFMLGVLVLVVATAVFRRPRWKLDALTKAAIALLTAFTLWSFASILWAEVPAEAWDGANRTLMYLIVFSAFALPRWPPRLAIVVMSAYALAMAGVAGGVLWEIADGEAAGSFIDGRLIDPAGYQNATAALFLAPSLIAIGLASRREVPWQLRGLLVGAAALQIEVAILPQSRGALLTFPIALIALVLLQPSKLRALSATALVLGFVALATPSLLDVFNPLGSTGPAGTVPALVDAASTMALTVLAVALLGTVLALLDSRHSAGARLARNAERAARGVLVASFIAVVVGALIAVGNPIAWADERWSNFKSGYSEGQFEESRFDGGLGNNRYDFWRVGLSTSFTDSPLIGAGADNFATDYLRERRSSEEPAYPHSLPVRTLAGTGLVGGSLLAGFFVTAAIGIFKVARRGPPVATAVATTLSATVIYWLLHSGGDWLWSFPAVSAPAFAWLAIAARTEPEEGHERSRLSGWVMAAGAALAALAAASLVLPWGAAVDSNRAAESWRSAPAAAFDRLDRASQMNFLSADPDLLAGTIAIELGLSERAMMSFEAALEREPTNWYALLQLGALASRDGDDGLAESLLERARDLNPKDLLVRESLRKARRGRPISTEMIEDSLLARVCARVGRTPSTRYCRDG